MPEFIERFRALPDHARLGNLRIQGTLTASSPLRIGSGVLRRGEPNAVLKDHQGNPCLPGSSLKGFLRCRGTGIGEDWAKRMLGEGGDTGRRSRLTLHWAWQVGNAKPTIRWGNQIEPVRGTVDEHHLYRQEQVAERTAFQWSLDLNRATKGELKEVLSLLAGLDGQADCTFGHGTSGLQGRLTWSLDAIRQQDLRHPGAWRETDQGYEWKSEGAWVDLWRKGQEDLGIQGRKPPIVGQTFTLRLHMSSDFLVNDPEEVKPEEARAKGKPSSCFTRDANGNPVVPWRTLRGNLKAQARRILLTLAHQAPPAQRDSAIGAANALLATLFGKERGRGCFRTGDATVTQPHTATAKTRTFLPVDRFLGAGGGEKSDTVKLHTAEVAEGRTLEAKGVLDPLEVGQDAPNTTQSPEHVLACRTLLYLVLRDGVEGDITVGGRTGRGLGAFKLEVLDEQQRPVDLLAWCGLGELDADPKVALEFAMAYMTDAIGCSKGTPAKLAPQLVDPNAIERPAERRDRPPQPLPTRFYPPYHFLSALAPNHLTEWKDKPKDWASHVPHARHDCWVPDTYSGRVLCSVKLETPTFVGAGFAPNQEDGEIKEILPYKACGKDALPGSSLRGMVSSLAETLSNSTMRALQDQHYSVRKSKALGGIGLRGIDASTHEFFEAISPDLVPMKVRGEGPTEAYNRNQLTPAELLFGFVAQGKLEREKNGRALKGRLRFSDAQFNDGVEGVRLQNPDGSAIPLRILASPKSPSPSMYARPYGNENTLVPKNDNEVEVLPSTNPRTYRPGLSIQHHRLRGRKFFTHHVRLNVNLRDFDWKTLLRDENKDQKVKIRPLEANQTLRFHVDFDNLTSDELALLLTAAQPSEGFRHRLGLGKPLGLGTVCVKPEALLLVDRQARYREPGPRWAWMAKADTFACERWAPHYPDEAKALQEAQEVHPLQWSPGTLVDLVMLRQLCLVGEPDRLGPDIPVVPVPLIQGKLDKFRDGNLDGTTEKETFEWFKNPKPLTRVDRVGPQTYYLPIMEL